MDEFMEECELLNCRIDHLATHKYLRPGEEDAVIFTGSGTTAAIHKLINAMSLDQVELNL